MIILAIRFGLFTKYIINLPVLLVPAVGFVMEMISPLRLICFSIS